MKAYQQLLEEKEVPAINQLSQALEQYQGLQEHLAAADNFQKKLNFQKNIYKEAEEKYHKLRRDYEAMYQAYFQEQAGILAAQLKEDEPCPVCGSRIHPQKAELSSGAPTREQVEQMKKERDEKEGLREKEQETLLRLQGLLEKEMAVIQETQRRLLDSRRMVSLWNRLGKMEKLGEKSQRTAEKRKKEDFRCRKETAGIYRRISEGSEGRRYSERETGRKPEVGRKSEKSF